jgi:pheromone a factor receptor
MDSSNAISVTTSPVADPVNAIALPIFALLGIFITYLPFRSFYAHGNIAACSIVFTVTIYNIFTFINALIWPDDNWNRWWTGEGLCDVEALLRYPITMALATSLCCLTKGLAGCLDTENAKLNLTTAAKRRRQIIDFLFCWLVPVGQMALHYVCQAGRYAIVPVFGCADALDNSWPAIIILMLWLPLFALLNCYYAGMFSNL